jgi:hypothetical protein
MTLSFIQLIELKTAVIQRIEVLEQRTFGVSSVDMPYSHKALGDMREVLAEVEQASKVGDYLL